jgi:O-antigen/teichoic acid export membrane protein
VKFRNIFYSGGSSAFSIIIAAVTFALLWDEIDRALFGFLALLWTTQAIVNISDFGLGRIACREIARESTSENGHHRTYEAITNLAISTGVIIAFIYIIIVAAIATYGHYHHSSATTTEGLISIAIGFLGVPAANALSVAYGSLEAKGRFDRTSIFRTVVNIWPYIFPVVFHAMFVDHILIWTAATSVVIRSATLFMAQPALQISNVISRHSKLTFALSMNNMQIGSMARWLALSSIFQPVFTALDRFVLSFICGVDSTALFAIPYEYTTRMSVISGAIGNNLLPQLASQRSRNGWNPSVRRVAIFVSFIMAIVSVAGLMAYQPICNFLVTAEVAKSTFPAAVILAIGIVFNGASYVFYNSLISCGNTRIVAIIHGSELLAAIPLSYFLITKFGITGAAISWTLRAGMDCILMMMAAKKSCDNSDLAPAQVARRNT